MRTTLASIMAILAGTLLLTGCSAARNPEDNQANAAPQATAKKAPKDKSEEKDKKVEKLEDEMEEMERQRAKMERELEIARHRLEKADLAGEHAARQQQRAIEEAQQQLQLAQRRMEIFEQFDVPTRTQRAELSVKYARDRLENAQEELEQLEKLYAEEQFADATKEIVLRRGRRDLKRAQENLELTQRDRVKLVEETLPLEQREHRLAVEGKQEALEQARQRQAESELDHRISVLSARSSVEQQEVDLDVHREKMERKEQELEEARES